MGDTLTRGSTSLTGIGAGGRKPRRGRRVGAPTRIAWRLALGAVIALNALCAICWPAVTELVRSYL